MSPFNCPDSGGLHNYSQDEKDGTEGGTFSSRVQPGIYVGKSVETESTDKVKEEANSYEYIA
jgi:hypothetical protein